ncbi:unnamed protein product, partial [Mesorhabditis spiculigera]
MAPRHLLILLGLVTEIRSEFSTIRDILENTNKRLPTQNTSRPLDVHLGFYLESIGNFRAEEMSFDVDMYAYMSWNDWRLRHNFPDYVMVNDDAIRQQLWLPDLYFANAIKSKVHDVTVPNFSLFIDRDDAYIAKQVNVTWFNPNPVRFNPSIGLPEFEITNVTEAYCNGTYRYAVTPTKYKVDTFSCLLGNIHLSRSIGYNLVQSYIPTGLIVIISWVSFWIDRRAVPARVTLSFTTLVSLTTLGNGLRFGLPQVSYAKAIDFWYGACMLFVFMALLEFAIINSYMRKAEKYGEMAKKFMQSRVDNTDTVEPKEMGMNDIRKGSKSPKSSAKNSRSPVTPHMTPETRRSLANNNSYEPYDPRIANHRPKPKIFGDRIRFADEELPMTVINGSLSSYDNLSPRRRGTVHVRREDLDISDDDEELFDKAVQERTKPFVVYATDNGTAIFYNAEKQKAIEEQKMAAQRKRRMSRYRLSVCENAYSTMSKSFSRTALHIDKGCRYGFPLVFLFWNLFYWWFYLFWRKNMSIFGPYF